MEESADRSAKALCVTRSLKKLEISLDRLVSSVTMARLLCLANMVDYKRYSVSFVSDS